MFRPQPIDSPRGRGRAAALLAALALCALGAPASAQTRALGRVQKLEAREEGGKTVVTIQGTATPTFTVYKLEKPERVVIDVSNTQLGVRLDGPVSVNTWAVGQIQVQELGEADAASTRIIVQLARPATYQVKAVGNNVVVTVSPREAKPAPETTVDTASRDEAKAAKADAERARAEAQAAKADAEQARGEASRAKADADASKKSADARVAAAEERMRAADARMAAAESAQKAAEREKLAADKARKDAEKALASADEKGQSAEKVARAAEDRRTQAEREAKDAEAKARRAEAAGTADATRRRKEAEAAAAQADQRRAEAEAKRQEAESALARAEAKRKEVDDARLEAESSRARAVAAKKDAEKARGLAVAERDTARAQRDQAEKARVAAVNARQAEEDRAAAVSRVRGDEEKRAAAAAAARGREERAAAVAEDKRVAAEAARKDAETALVAVQSQRAEAEKAEKAAATRRVAADKAVKEAEQLAAQKGQESQEFKRAEARAKKAADEQRSAEADLAARKTALADEEKRADKARGTRDRLVADAGAARQAADEARAAREVEEKKRDRVAREREVEEKKLAEARSAREVEEGKLASAERSRREAEARAVAARQDADRARAENARVESARPAPAPVRSVARAETPAPEPERRASVRVSNVDYVDRADQARVVIALSGPAQPQIIAQGGRQAILSIDAADIPRSLERSLDTSEFDGPVTSISSYRDPRDPTRVRIVVDLSEPAQGKLSRSGDTWNWDFARPNAQAKRGKKPAAAHAVAYEAPVVGGYGAASTPVTAQTVAQKKKIYRGKRIDLDFKDADLHNLLRLLAQVGDVNIVIPDGVRATVTVRLTDVPWDQAMEVILQSKDLWYRREGRLIRIAPRKLLDAEDEEERARKKAMIQEEQPEPVVFTLNYSVASQMARQVQPLLSPKGKIEVDERTNSLIINDIRANRGRVIALLSQLDTQTPQIQIEARVVEARSSWSREIGIQWGLGALASAAGGNPTGLIFPSTVGVFGGATDAQAPTAGLVGNPDFAVNLPAAVGTGAGGALGLTFGSVSGNFNLSLRISAAEDTGTVRIISAPRITVLNNTAASISQGVSIPISVVSASGVSTQFVQADLKLDVTPHVSQRDCSIQLDVSVSKNEADFVNTGARGDPTILRKEAKTTMLIADGETTVIGGIYTRNSGKAYQKVPFFGDIPILGYFFRFQRETDERTEVLIFLSPKITNKASLRCEAAAQE